MPTANVVSDFPVKATANDDVLFPSMVGRYLGRLVYTSSGSFVKADYLGARHILVKVQGAGGGSAGAAATSGGQIAQGGGGGGGGYAEKFVAVAGLDATELVTVGAGGSAGGSGGNGGTGNTSSALGVSATGGAGGTDGTAFAFTAALGGTAGDGGVGSGGDLNVRGSGASSGVGFGAGRPGQSQGGGSMLGGPKRARVSLTLAGESPLSGAFGAGANGGVNSENRAAVVGAAGAPGIVILELFA
jgi:hypothetical protein